MHKLQSLFSENTWGLHHHWHKDVGTADFLINSPFFLGCHVCHNTLATGCLKDVWWSKGIPTSGIPYQWATLWPWDNGKAIWSVRDGPWGSSMAGIWTLARPSLMMGLSWLCLGARPIDLRQLKPWTPDSSMWLPHNVQSWGAHMGVPNVYIQSNLVRKSLFTTSTSLQQHTWQERIQWSLY